jgi:deoxyribonuclease-4
MTTGGRIGSHMSVAGGAAQAFARGREIACESMQIFTRSPNQWAAKPLDPEGVALFRRERERGDVFPVIVHGSYLMNLAAPEGGLVRERSLAAFGDEIARAEALTCDALVFHPGAHMGEGIDAGVARVAAAVRAALDAAPRARVRILIENTAGQGSSLGSRFEELRALLDAIGGGDRVGICLDTCHLFAAGYDLSSRVAYAATLALFDSVVGVGRIGAWHLNDSKKPLGSRVDRHEHIGLGLVGTEGFAALLADERFRGKALVLETEKGDDGKAWDVRNLALLRRLRGEALTVPRPPKRGGDGEEKIQKKRKPAPAKKKQSPARRTGKTGLRRST